MRVGVADIEADGLRADVTQIWCVVVQDYETKEIFRYGPDDLVGAYKKLNEFDAVVFHNGIAYDIPVLEKLVGKPHKLGPCTFLTIDTLCLSRLYFADKYKPPCFGQHSLGNWGKILKFPKGDYKDFSKYTPEMMTYCVQDVELTSKIYELFTSRRNKDGSWDNAIRLEYSTTHILGELMANGFAVDIDSVNSLVAASNVKMNEALEKLAASFPDKIVEEEMKTPEYWIDSTTDTHYRIKADAPTGVRRSLVRGPNKVKRTVTPFNPRSATQVVAALQEKYGWKPEVLTDAGSPSTGNEVLDELEYPECDLILDYRLYGKKESQANEWINAVKPDGRIYGSIISNGAPTGRMSHSGPNMAQIPRVGKPLGLECRSCFGPRKNYVQVGADASGLELRCLADAMYPFDGGEYGRLILEGDIHSFNQVAAGLDTRDQAKTFIFALVYGAGEAKLGRIVGGTKKDGKKLKAKFFDSLPALRKVVDNTIAEYNRLGYLVGLDGRKLPVRAEHAALNTRLQSNGAIIMKTALCLFYQQASERFGPHPWKYGDPGRWAMLAVVHDEFQAECEPKIVDKLGQLMVDSIKQAGVFRGFKMELDGEYKHGNNWAECH